MAASANVEQEASIFLQKLMADRTEEPTKLASRLFLVRAISKSHTAGSEDKLWLDRF